MEVDISEGVAMAVMEYIAHLEEHAALVCKQRSHRQCIFGSPPDRSWQSQPLPLALFATCALKGCILMRSDRQSFGTFCFLVRRSFCNQGWGQLEMRRGTYFRLPPPFTSWIYSFRKCTAALFAMNKTLSTIARDRSLVTEGGTPERKGRYTRRWQPEKLRKREARRLPKKWEQPRFGVLGWYSKPQAPDSCLYEGSGAPSCGIHRSPMVWLQTMSPM